MLDIRYECLLAPQKKIIAFENLTTLSSPGTSACGNAITVLKVIKLDTFESFPFVHHI